MFAIQAGGSAVKVLGIWLISVLLLGGSNILATPPSTPLDIELSLDNIPTLNQFVTATVTVTSKEDAPNTRVELSLPQGTVIKGRSKWTLNIRKDQVITLKTQIKLAQTGNLQLHAIASRKLKGNRLWYARDTVPVALSGTTTSLAWEFDWVGEGQQSAQGDTPISPKALTSLDIPFPSTDLTEVLPEVEPQQEASSFSSLAPASPGNFTIRGRWRYHDRNQPNPIERDIDQQLVEVRKGNGAALNPRCFGFTDSSGNFSLTCKHTGTNDYRVWVWSWTSFSCSAPGCPNLLGVFNGPETPGGCGNSTSLDCSYPVTTQTINCSDGATCNIGTWVVSRTTPGEPWVGAHQMTQDLIRSWKRIFFAPRPTSATAGSGFIDYPVPAGHGTHAHVGNDPLSGWISIPPGSQLSADIVAHEYGHLVMNNLYDRAFPFNDCPSPHYVDRASGPSCGHTEGFANFWASFGNQFYDGDGQASNDGPIFNWGPSVNGTNLETRDLDIYGTGDLTEGNVAGALWDIYDSANDNRPGAGIDQFSDGIGRIWQLFDLHNTNNFREWWAVGQGSYPRCPVLQVLWNNTISNHPDYNPPSSCNVALSLQARNEAVPLNVSAVTLSPSILRVAEAKAQFDVIGTGIESLQIVVFDLSGRPTFDSGAIVGTHFIWHGQDNRGQRLANGVYLYVVRVRGYDGKEYVSEVRKLVILR